MELSTREICHRIVQFLYLTHPIVVCAFLYEEKNYFPFLAMTMGILMSTTARVVLYPFQEPRNSFTYTCEATVFVDTLLATLPLGYIQLVLIQLHFAFFLYQVKYKKTEKLA